MTESLKQRALALAMTKLGVHEVGNNWGPEVQAFLKAAGINEPAPWCASFCNWAAENAAKAMNITSPLEKVPLQGYVQSYVDHGKKNGWVVDPKDVVPGDLFCIFEDSVKRYGHIGFVTSMDAKRGVYTTLEGNTNTDGSREGVEVAKRTRNVGPKVLFLRWSN